MRGKGVGGDVARSAGVQGTHPDAIAKAAPFAGVVGEGRPGLDFTREERRNQSGRREGIRFRSAQQFSQRAMLRLHEAVPAQTFPGGVHVHNAKRFRRFRHDNGA